MNVDTICLGTWLPRTSIHLKEVYNFFIDGTAVGLDQSKLKHLISQLCIEDLLFNNNPDFNNIRFSSGNIEVTITEDGIIVMTLKQVKDVHREIRTVESFYTNQLGPALSYLFSRGAPLPQTLLNIKEVYPRILLGKNMALQEVEAYFKAQDDALITSVSSEKLTIYYGEKSEFIDISNVDTQQSYNEFLDSLLTCSIFIRSFSGLLERYLQSHRSVWMEISSIRETRNLRYSDFTMIRNTILDILKTIAFIKARLHQMSDILSLRNALTPESIKQKLFTLGLSSFTTLEKSSQYMDNLWEMTADYSNSTMTLFASILEENAQRELRLLQQITIAGSLFGFFGMNIAFPWEERWNSTFLSSFVVFGIIILTLAISYVLIKKIILNRCFKINLTKPLVTQI